MNKDKNLTSLGYKYVFLYINSENKIIIEFDGDKFYLTKLKK